MHYLPYINNKNIWSLKELNFSDQNNLIKDTSVNLNFKEAFIGGEYLRNGW
jgi:hypothetical protein